MVQSRNFLYNHADHLTEEMCVKFRINMLMYVQVQSWRGAERRHEKTAFCDQNSYKKTTAFCLASTIHSDSLPKAAFSTGQHKLTKVGYQHGAKPNLLATNQFEALDIQSWFEASLSYYPLFISRWPASCCRPSGPSATGGSQQRWRSSHRRNRALFQLVSDHRKHVAQGKVSHTWVAC